MRLSQIATVISGHPFRSKIAETKGGDTLVVQMKDVSGAELAWGGMVSTQITKPRSERYLREGDIVIIARGNRNTAILITQPPSQSVCSPHFFVIRVHDPAQVNPAFLSWYLCQQPAQQYFERNAQGTGIRSVRRQTFEEMPLPVVEYEKQLQLAKLARSITDHQKALVNMIENDQQLMNSIAQSL